jgi:putative DNA primase/helicase
MKATIIKEVRTARFAAGVEKFTRGSPGFAMTGDQWDTDTMLLGTPTGTMNLRTGMITKAKASDMIAKQTLVTPGSLPLCPRWITFLLEACGGDQSVVDFLQRWCGYCLTGHTREHALVFLHGPGGNGKSVFINVISKLMGSYAAVSPMETFVQAQGSRHPTELAFLNGPRLVIASETEKGRNWNEERIKSVTGGDAITARFMREDFFTFVPQFKLLIIGNHTPKLVNVDDATRRRFAIVPFTAKPKNVDKFLEQVLIEQEGPEILAWMVEGCLDWQGHSLLPPEKITKATSKYFHDEDVIGQFLDECCVIGEGFTEASGLLYLEYRGWEEKHIGEKPLSIRAWGDILEEKGFPRYRTKSERGHRGLRKRNYLKD